MIQAVCFSSRLMYNIFWTTDRLCCMLIKKEWFYYDSIFSSISSVCNIYVKINTLFAWSLEKQLFFLPHTNNILSQVIQYYLNSNHLIAEHCATLEAFSLENKLSCFWLFRLITFFENCCFRVQSVSSDYTMCVTLRLM